MVSRGVRSKVGLKMKAHPQAVGWPAALGIALVERGMRMVDLRFKALEIPRLYVKVRFLHIYRRYGGYGEGENAEAYLALDRMQSYEALA
jgi:hypothetical protein